MLLKLELAPVIMNICICLAYLLKGDEPWKAVYWFGAVILTIGLYFMEG